MCVLFTQSKNTLREHKFLLGKHSISHEDVKMASVEVFIRAVIILKPSQDLEFFISNIFVFLFLPYSASRECSTLNSQLEVKRCIRRREEVLKALECIVPQINDPQITAELAICLELCENVPSLSIKSLILDICKQIQVASLNDLQKLESLIRKIREGEQGLKEKSFEAWGWIVIKYAGIVDKNDSLDEETQKNVISAIIEFFHQTCTFNVELAIKTLDEIWKLDGFEVKVFLADVVLKSLWKNNQIEVVLEFLAVKSMEHVKYFGGIVKDIERCVLEYGVISCRIITFITKRTQNCWLFNYFLPIFMKIFQVKKPVYTNEEIQFVTEVIKLLMTVYLKSSDKTKTITGIFPLFLSLYHQSYPMPVIKAVSKALTYIHNNSFEAFEKNLAGLTEAEKKFVESQLETQNVAAAKTVAQPSITLSLRFKKN